MAKQTFSVGQVLTAAQMTSLQQTAMLGGSTTAKTTSYTLVAADAGTVVSVNSTSATTITINTGLFSAGDIVTIQNWGSGAVTITAGTATVNTAGSLIVPQYDGGVLYFTSTSAAIYFDWVQAGATSPLTTKGDIWGYGTSDARIPVGANDTVLTADSTQTLGVKWASPAGGWSPNLTLLSTTAVSGGSVQINVSSYDYYAIYFYGVSSNTASDYLNFRINASSTGSHYKAQDQILAKSKNQTSPAYTDTGAQHWNTTSFTKIARTGTNAAKWVNGVITCLGGKTTGAKSVQWTTSADYENAEGAGTEGSVGNGIFDNGAAITSFTFFFSSGDFDNGDIYVYGG